MQPRLALARRRARELLAAGRVTTPPTPVEALVVVAGAVLRLEPFAGDLSGMVHRRSGCDAIIGVNSLHARSRQRFTIAHEIGHLLLHKGEDLHVDERFPIGLRNSVSSLAVDPHEIEANQFAAELLMPTEMLLRELRDRSLDIESDSAVAELATRYDVSVQAMIIRLSKLKLFR